MNTTHENGPSLFLVAVTFVGFVSLGLPDAVVGVAWPFLRKTFALPEGRMGWILIGSGFGYLVSSSGAPRLLKSLQLGLILAASTALVSFGILGYSLAPHWVLFLCCAPIIGLGSGAIDTGLNSYAARFFSVRQMNWLHACYGIGATMGPTIMSSVLVQGFSWRLGYAILGGILSLLTLLFVLTRNLWVGRGSASSNHNESLVTVTGLRVLQHPMVRLHILIFFLYTGIEAAIGQWSFTIQTEWRALSTKSAGTGTVSYWAALTCGRIVLGFVAERLGAARLLRMGTVGAFLGALLFAFGTDFLCKIGLILSGFCLAPVFPSLVSLTPKRVGRSHSVQAIGFQMSAALVGAIAFPSVGGLLAEWVGVRWLPVAFVGATVLLIVVHERALLLDRAQHAATLGA